MALHKQGLDYYSHPLGMTTGIRTSNIRRKYGSTAIDVWLALLDLIYKDKGYYISYGEADRNDVIWDIAGRVRGKDAPDEETIGRIIDELVRDGFFDADLAYEGILTSEEIQEQFYLSTLKRRRIEIEWQYWLLDLHKMYSLATKSPILKVVEEYRRSLAANGRNVDGNMTS